MTTISELFKYLIQIITNKFKITKHHPSKRIRIHDSELYAIVKQCRRDKYDN